MFRGAFPIEQGTERLGKGDAAGLTFVALYAFLGFTSFDDVGFRLAGLQLLILSTGCVWTEIANFCKSFHGSPSDAFASSVRLFATALNRETVESSDLLEGVLMTGVKSFDESLEVIGRHDFEFVEYDKLTNGQRDALKKLKSAVYPPEALLYRLRRWFGRRLSKFFHTQFGWGTLPGRRYSWVSPQWLILIKEGNAVITTVGLTVREITINGNSKKIGGISRVMTHPARRRRGLASNGMQEAAWRFHNELHVSFALLFCRPPVVPFYKGLRWKPFEGNVFADQPEGKIDFKLKGPMVLDVREQAPINGTLDLNGFPW
jgi:hypothetical protein